MMVKIIKYYSNSVMMIIIKIYLTCTKFKCMKQDYTGIPHSQYNTCKPHCYCECALVQVSGENCSSPANYTKLLHLLQIGINTQMSA